MSSAQQALFSIATSQAVGNVENILRAIVSDFFRHCCINAGLFTFKYI